MPARWVTRKNVDGRDVGEPQKCFVANAIVAEPGVRTVEQCIAALVGAGETVIGNSDKRPVMSDGQLVGYITITHRDYPESPYRAV